ncbi:SigB/SigF/SigG family RNA polymerase sigma factor [Thermocrispum sp.]|uniref:SigB/SigF/SigG family RNA polymerase sigma factor n=2 Tax=Thermocrispum agreste TaxID=37925 RepID=A0ABD6FGG1_9PSEU|nr:SigB/SigF/SigG family RNA polymerase sigma factor [Thermocrispum sp.]
MTSSHTAVLSPGRTTETPRPAGSHGEFDAMEPLLVKLTTMHAADPGRARLRERIIDAHLPLATRLARGYQHRGEPTADLIQVAIIGLIKAVDRYEPAVGRGFLPYAIPTIRGELRRHFRDSTWALRVPRRLKELHLALQRAGDELLDELGRAPRPSELARHLGIPVTQVHEGLTAAAAYHPSSLNRPAGSPDDPGSEVGDFVGDVDGGFDNVLNIADLEPALAQLPERERRILVLRFYREMTQSEIARVVGLSQMHVSRLLAQSLRQLREILSQPAPLPQSRHDAA